MGECCPPTAADYASAAAYEAQKRIQEMNKKMDELVARNEQLTQQIVILEGKLAALSFSIAKLKGK